MAESVAEAVTAKVETQAADAAAAAAAGPTAPKAADDPRIAQLLSQVSALQDTVKGALAPRPVQAAPDGKFPINPQLRQIMRQNGLTDADIDHNWQVVGPMLAAVLQTEGGALLSELQLVKDDVAMAKMARNEKKYPDFAIVAEKMDELRASALKQGQYLAPEAAYKAAVAESLDQVSEARQRRQRESEASRNSDRSPTDHGTGAGRVQGTRRTALTAEDLANLSREDRKKYFESIGDRPIR